MLGKRRRFARACASTFILSLFAGAIAQSAPPSSLAHHRHRTVAQLDTQTNDRPTEAPAETEPAALELVPAETAELNSAVILQMAAEANGEPRRVQVASASTSDKTQSEAVRKALELRGSRYRYGGTSRGGFDCSGFTRYVYARLGVTLPHGSAAQFKCGKPVARGSLKSGDLVFFSRGGRAIGHVGIYIGDSKFVHASNPSRGVTVDSLGSAYYSRTYRGARRVAGK